jgi:hypothetical protein
VNGRLVDNEEEPLFQEVGRAPCRCDEIFKADALVARMAHAIDISAKSVGRGFLNSLTNRSPGAIV